MTTLVLLRDAIGIPEKVTASDFVLKLHEGVENASHTVADYVVTPALAEAFGTALATVDSALADNKDVGAFLHGSFGSGKSHFMAMLHLLLAGNAQARALPGLQEVVAARHALLDGSRGKLLVLDYHLVGAQSFEQALFSGYLRQVAALHPDRDLPVLHRTDALFDDAAGMRAAMGDDVFFEKINAAGSAGWAAVDGGWGPDSFARAVASAQGDAERDRLATALVQSLFTSYRSVGEWADLDAGLGTIAAHAKSLGYSGIVLFLDELVLWLASHLADPVFVNTEAEKVAKLVEPGIGKRAVPLVSFVARQRDLRDFFGDSVPGVQRAAVGDAFQWWEGRFDRIEIKASNLADVAQKRLLAPTSPEGAEALAGSLAAVKRHTKAWDVLLRDEQGAGEADFAKVYPFSPALVDTLVALSAQLQRERTALKVMAQLLSNGRDSLRVTDVIPVGDLYDVMVEGGDPPLTEEMARLFEVARDLYRRKLRPVILAANKLDEQTVAATDVTGDLAVRQASFRTDDRLVKTLIISALAPVQALRDLTASKLAYLNYGTVASPLGPGTEVTQVLAKVRGWGQQVGELEVGDGPDPIVSLTLAGVDYESIVERVRSEDNDGAKRTLLRRLVFEQLGVQAENLFNETPYPIIWRGTKRSIDIVFGNIRDRDTLPDDALRASGDGWKVIIDYPFEFDAGFGPQDDVARISQLKSSGVTSRTLAWIPGFLSRERQKDLGRLVLLEHLLAGPAFEQNSLHLSANDRVLARQMLDAQRRSLREALGSVLKAAYGITKGESGDLDVSFGSFDNLVTLDDVLEPQQPAAGTLKDALHGLIDQMLSSQFPLHPKVDPGTTEVRRADLNLVLAMVTEALSRAGGRVEPLESPKRSTLQRVANPLKVGECYASHYVFNAQLFGWRNDLARWASEAGLATIPVSTARQWFKPYGMPAEMENLVLCAWALLDDKQWIKASAPVTISGVEQVTNDLELREPELPAQELWEAAVPRAAALFGITVAPLRNAANVGKLSAEVRRAAVEKDQSAARLVVALEEHRDLLGLTDESPRLVTARATSALVHRLAVESDDVVLVSALAEAAVPAEPQAWAKSISASGAVAASIAGCQWNLLASVSGIKAEDRRRDAADALFGSLHAAAAGEELHGSLGPALMTAVASAGKLLSETVVADPQPKADPVGKTVDDIPLADVDSKLEHHVSAIRAALEANPGKGVHIEWWLT